MKILLILPATENLRVNRDNPEIPKRAMLRFSLLPLTTVAALTPTEHDVSICDENVEAVDFDADADLIGISFMTAYAPRAYEIAREFRLRGKMVVAGGYHPTFLPEEVVHHFDAVVVGDAEGIWPQVVQDADGGRLQNVYRQPTPPSLSNQPLPRRDLLRRTAQHYATTDAVQIGRGCIHNCTYCSITAFHCGTYRRRSLDSILDELNQIGRDFIFVDDNIIADPEFAKKLFHAMKSFQKRWVSQASIKIADDPELLHLARASGCQGLFIGIENVNPENLRSVDKGFNDPAGYQQCLGRIRKAGIGVFAGMIVGMDGDDLTVFQHMLRFLNKNGIDGLQLNILTPLPGTPLYTDMDKTGRMMTKDWNYYDFRHVVFTPSRMTAEQLQNGADWVYREFYRLDRILSRFCRTLWTVGPVQAVLALRLGLTYRYDNLREDIRGCNPAKDTPRGEKRWKQHWQKVAGGTGLPGLKNEPHSGRNRNGEQPEDAGGALLNLEGHFCV